MEKFCNLLRRYVTVGNVCRLVNVLINCFAYACTFMLIYVYLYKDEYTWRNKYLFANKEDVVTTGLFCFENFFNSYNKGDCGTNKEKAFIGRIVR